MDPQNVEKLYFLQRFLFESDNPNSRTAASNYLKASLLLNAESTNLESAFSHRLNAQQVERECCSQYKNLVMRKSEGGIFSTVDMKVKAALEKKRKKDENFENCLKNAQSGMFLDNLLSMACAVDTIQRPSVNFATYNSQATKSFSENSRFQKDVEICREALARIFPPKNANLEFITPALEGSKICTISRETQTTAPYHYTSNVKNIAVEEIVINNKLDVNELSVEEKNGSDLKNGFITARTLSVQQKNMPSSKKRPQLPLAPIQPPTKRPKFIIPRTTSESIDDDMAALSCTLNAGTIAGKATSKRAVKSVAYTTAGSTGGSVGNGITGEEGNEIDERLRNLDPKMIEMIRNEIMSTPLSMTWDSIAGLKHAKETIKEAITYPMLRPDIFTGLRSPPRGLLLFGPPGTGKTLIAKCIASQSNATFFSISASALTSKWVGDGEKMVRTLFGVARCSQPAIIFFDEIDSILTQRTDGENEASRKIKTEFLVQFDGCGTTAEEDRILIIGATNRPHEIDEAVRRRFRKRLYIPLPSHEARLGIIKNLIKCQTHSLTEEDIDKICSATEGYSGSDMDGLCREAALGPIRSIPIESITTIDANDVRPISASDFENALTQVRASVAEKDLGAYLKFNQDYGSLN